MTGIVGCNGSGKSSIIEAIGFLFTGETDDPKDAVITAGSNGASFVRGTFTLNDKVGTIERHLDSSRVVLEYDGLKLHKAGEVKELWTKLLQIDGHIFNHVIVAKQKRIPELFSGETQIREKAFQRIFMVPNTERLRSLIWDSYMKTCPPPLPEDDIQAIDKQVQDLQAQVGPRQEKLNLLSDSTLTDHQVTAVLNYTEYYNKCISDAEQQPALESQRAQLQTNIAVFAEKIVSLQDTLDKWPKDLEQEKQVCYSAYERHLAYNKKASELNGAKTDLVNLQVDGEVLGAEILVLEEKKTALGGKKIALDMEISKLTEEQSLLSSLVSSPTCPTCHQPLQDVASHLAEVQQKLQNLR